MHRAGRLKTQQGTSKLILLLLLAVLVFFINLAVRLIPIYVDHFYTRSIVNALVEEAGDELDRHAFLEQFQRRARVNQVHLDNDVFSFEGREPMQIHLNYERRVPVMYNVDAVVSFNESFPAE